MKSAFLKPAILAMAALAAFTGTLGAPGASSAAAQPLRQEAGAPFAHVAAFQTARHDSQWRGHEGHDRDREAPAHRHVERRNEHRTTEHVNRGHAPKGRWSVGERLPSAYRTRGRVIAHPAAHHLRRPPRGHHWVRVGTDAVLVAAGTGVIVGLAYGLFH
ncbi:RcnB family protein [Azospirillum sp. SYSU D00513]|uniref:RcnB family protein n=1 Tax=Azospirillum sp. SYSU D00513 TaxID=2812561 RepID=UPI001FFF5A3D|nr:RcnB family protein [Azospirillum sp. SYSU D00513]